MESGVSSLLNADSFHRSTKNQVGQTFAKPNAPSKFFCPQHQEANCTTTFGRKAECKNHMLNFHNLQQEWKCPTCLAIFDRANDYSKHNRDEHAGQLVFPATDVVTNLLAKQVFACGFQSCENLFSSWAEWFDHITAHMRDGKKPSDWSYTVVIRNLLRQPNLRDAWEQMMLRSYGTTQHMLEWDPSTARQLCQKLECRDFRPGVHVVVQAANLLGQRMSSDQLDLLCRETRQIRLATPSCDSVPYYEDNEELDRILMRPTLSNTASTPGVHALSRPYFPPVFDQHQVGGNVFGFMGMQPLSGILQSDQSHIDSYRKNGSAQGYEQTQTEQYSQLSPQVFHEELPQLQARLDFAHGVEAAFADATPASDRDEQPTHILQEFQYYDYPKFAKLSKQRSLHDIIRRVRSSTSLSSKKSHSSLEAESTQAAPPPPPLPSNSITPPTRSRASSTSQRSWQPRK